MFFVCFFGAETAAQHTLGVLVATDIQGWFKAILIYSCKAGIGRQTHETCFVSEGGLFLHKSLKCRGFTFRIFSHFALAQKSSPPGRLLA